MKKIGQQTQNYLSHLKETYVDQFSYKNHTILFSVATCLLLFKSLKYILLDYSWAPESHIIGSFLLFIICLIALPIKKQDLPALIKPLIYVSSGMAVFYLTTARDPFLYNEIDPQIALELQLLAPIAIATFLLGFWRPVFALVPFVLMNWKKANLSYVYGYSLFKTDFEIIVEMGVLFLCGFLILGAFKRLQNNESFFTLNIKKVYQTAIETHGTKLHLLEYIAFIGLAIHMSNYFYSGWQKTVISPSGINPFYWVFENYTQYLLLTNNEMGLFPFSFNETIAKGMFTFLDYGYIGLNLMVLIGQLASLFILRNIKATLWLTLFFDIMHVVIFLTTGIFFWKWIILNTSIVIALTAFGNRKISTDFKNFLCLFVLCAPLIFWIERLGWFETHALNHFTIEAITSKHETVEIPPSYFWSASGTISQNALIGKVSQRRPFYFDTMTMATTNKYYKMHPANRCENWHIQDYAKHRPFAGKNYDPTQYYETKVIANTPVYKNLVAFFQRQHNFIKEKQPSKLEIYLYPHHFYSWWWNYPEFQNLDFNDIIGYRVKTEAVCLGFENGEFTKETLASDQHDIFVK